MTATAQTPTDTAAVTRAVDERLSATVLITEREVAFATAAAVPLQPPATHWWTAARTRWAARPKRFDCARRYTWLEDAAMSRAMDRL